MTFPSGDVGKGSSRYFFNPYNFSWRWTNNIARRGIVEMTPDIGWFPGNFTDELEEELVSQIKDRQQRASPIQKLWTKTGYNVFLMVVGRMKTEPILKKICHITNMIPTKDVKIHNN
jgi:hypothetical protein